MVLGVDPPRQGQGVGSALMAPVLARADAAAQPCYLETNKEINVKLYTKHGFEVQFEGDIPNGGPYLWTMKRMPR
jgi:ribosomal protein S18 acetylase RimI-like enzyme